MTTVVIPPGETLRRALHWYSEERAARPAVSSVSLVEEASLRFDLSPVQEAWLLELARAPAKPSTKDA